MDWPKQVRRGVTATMFMTSAAWIQAAQAGGVLPDGEARAAYEAALSQGIAAPVASGRMPVPQANAVMYPVAMPPMDAPPVAVSRTSASPVTFASVEPVASNPVAQNPAASTVVTVERFTVPLVDAATGRRTGLPEARPVAPTQMAAIPAQPVVMQGLPAPSSFDAPLLPPPEEAAYAQLMPAAGEGQTPPAAAPALMPLPGASGLPAPSAAFAAPAQPVAPSAQAVAPPAPVLPPPEPVPTNSKDLIRNAARQAREIRDNGNQPIVESPPVAPPAVPVPVAAAPAVPEAPRRPTPPMQAVSVPGEPTPQPAVAADAPIAVPLAEPPPESVAAPLEAPMPVAPPAAPKKKKVAKVSPNARFKPREETEEAVLRSQADRLTAESRAAEAGAPIALDRTRESDARLQSDEGIKEHTGVGVSISVRKPRIDANYELNQAYTALHGGDSPGAMAIYQRILDAQPKNTDALFGLATLYHRVGRLDKAKPLYVSLLAMDPGHKDGLNNFMMLLGEENPQEALLRLQSLERANPSYAPIPAQIAMIHQRRNELGEAVDAMSRATTRDRDNMQYRYNLAVLLDQAGNWNDAASIYQDVLAAVDRGEKVPATRDGIQQRLTYLLSKHSS